MAATNAVDLLNHEIEGTFVRLSRLEEQDIPQLWTNLEVGSNTDIWAYLIMSVPSSHAEMWNRFKSDATHVTYAVRADPVQLNYKRPATHPANIESRNEEVLGVVAYTGINTEHRALEIGGVILSPKLQRTTAATEITYLLLKEVFDNVGHKAEPLFRRIIWKCNSANEKSRRAALRFGFMYEGTLRRNRFVRGVWINSDWFSMIEDEWEPIKVGFEQWLDENNFDHDGKQKLTLEQCREKATRS